MLLLVHADARRIPLADESVQCVVTSPPYWGLRKYAGEQELVWGGQDGCRHRFVSNGTTRDHPDRGTVGKDGNGSGLFGGARTQASKVARGAPASMGGICTECGAWRGGYGLEPTVQMYIDHTVEILREIRRILRPDGVVFWNIGDSYSNIGKWGGSTGGKHANGLHGDSGVGRSRIINQHSKQATVRGCEPEQQPNRGDTALKPKDLCLIPQRVALAAQADGWWVRSDIIWAKPNTMPESVTDRPTNAYEHILMFTKSERYYWDVDAVREPHKPESIERAKRGWSGNGYRDYPGQPQLRDREEEMGTCHPNGRNMRNVWTFPTQPYSGAHFATFPEEIPRRAILAATSAFGACRQCGAPWERVVRASGGTIGASWISEKKLEIGKRMDREMNARSLDGTYTRTGVGWRPTCRCRGQHYQTRPCLVLDPFGGSGTTGRVAVALRRDCVLLDLAYGSAYKPLAETRTRGVQLEAFI